MIHLPAGRAALTAIAFAAAFSAGSAVAQDFRPKNSVTTQAAEVIADACLAWHRDHSDQPPPSVWVLDVDGVSIIVKRADGATRAAVEAAHAKARMALYSGRPSSAAQNSTGDGPASLAGLVESTLINAFPAPGGLPIVIDGQVVGAVGVAGMIPDPARSEHPDELCAQAGLDAVAAD